MSDIWKDISVVEPDIHQPCEYIIEVRCKGWYNANTQEHRFIADDREKPDSRISKWRVWDGESFKEKESIIVDIREHMHE